MKYIGIRGHRGAGKTTISYLLGNTIDYLIKNKDESDIDELYRTWCDDIIKDEKIIHECGLDYVYFDSFSDTLKLWVKLLIGCPSDYMYDDYYKDHMIINIKDFSYKIYEELPTNIKIHSHNELYEIMPKDKAPTTITKNIYISLRDFIMYFGLEVMQRFFGANVWVKSLRSSSSFYNSIFDDSNSYKLFTDIKTPGEVTYIKNNGGIVIKVSRPGHKKNSKGLDKLSQDNRFDYEINVNGDLYNTKEQIIEISKQILENGKEN